MNINSVNRTVAGIGCFVILRYHLEYSILADLVQHDSVLSHMKTDLPFLELVHIGYIVVMLPLDHDYLFVHDLHLDESLAFGEQEQIGVVDGYHTAIMEDGRVGDLDGVERSESWFFVIEELYYLLRRNRGSG